MKKYKVQNVSHLTILETLFNETVANKDRLTAGDLMVIYDTLKSLVNRANEPGPQQTKQHEMKVWSETK